MILSCLIASAALASAAERAGLLVGDYKGTSLELPSPVMDAKALAGALSKVGFDRSNITLLENPTKAELIDAIDAFGEKLSVSRGVGLFYFSGHGAQVDGKNYLIPAEAKLKYRDHLETEGLSVRYIATSMEGAQNGINMLILDACRNNELPSAKRKALARKGLAEMDGDGILFCFAAKDGQVGPDTGKGSVYTNALINHLATPGVFVLDMLTRVRKEVKDGTDGTQEPFFYSGLDQVFSLAPAKVAPMEVRRKPAPAPRVVEGGLLDKGEIGKGLSFDLPGGEKLEVRYVPGGAFVMGSPETEEDRSERENQVSVTLSRHYWMAETECTQGQWEALMGTNPSDFKGKKLPVENVSWEDAKSYVWKFNDSVKVPLGWKWVLPSEAQWERACRGGTKTAFSFGNELNGRQANCDGNYPYGANSKGPNLEKTSEARSYGGNGYGLYDMHGNVFEWCEDAWNGKAGLPGGCDPLGREGPFRVLRGGSWNSYAWICRSAYRYRITPTFRNNILGFRVALSSTE